MPEKAVIFYERLDKELSTFQRLRLTFEDGSEIVTQLGEFEVTDEWQPNSEADPLRIIARWDDGESGTPVEVNLSSSQVASDEFWEHVWPSGQSGESSFHG